METARVFGSGNSITVHALGQFAIAVDGAHVEKRLRVKQRVGFGRCDPLVESALPLAGGFAPFGITSHHVPGAQYLAGGVEPGAHALTQFRKVVNVLGVGWVVVVTEDDGVVLVRRDPHSTAPLAS